MLTNQCTTYLLLSTFCRERYEDFWIHKWWGTRLKMPRNLTEITVMFTCSSVCGHKTERQHCQFHLFHPTNNHERAGRGANPNFLQFKSAIIVRNTKASIYNLVEGNQEGTEEYIASFFDPSQDHPWWEVETLDSLNKVRVFDQWAMGINNLPLIPMEINGD